MLLGGFRLDRSWGLELQLGCTTEGLVLVVSLGNANASTLVYQEEEYGLKTGPGSLRNACLIS